MFVAHLVKITKNRQFQHDNTLHIIIYQNTIREIHAIGLGVKSQALTQYSKLPSQYRNFRMQYRNVHCLRFPDLERLNSRA